MALKKSAFALKNNTEKRVETPKKPDLKIVKKDIYKTKPYNDINLNDWKAYPHVKTDTWWEFASRDKKNGHSYDYHGNYIPQLAQQFYERYTKKNDIVLDLFFGSGTSGIEAVNMSRRCICVELIQELVDYVSQKFDQKQLVTDVNIICGDSASDDIQDKIKARLETFSQDSE